MPRCGLAVPVFVFRYVLDRVSDSGAVFDRGPTESDVVRETGLSFGEAVGEAAGSIGMDEISYPVVHVVDGDTFTVRMSDGGIGTVRILGIDAPETGKK